jgi:hypothetical protein
MKCNINNCETCKLETCELYEGKWIRKEKSIAGQDFENLLKAMQEAYPTCKGNYIDFDVYLKDVMIKFTESK